MSWIALPDALQIIGKLVEQPSIAQSLQSEEGSALNLVTDHAVSNAQFTAALGKALKRPTPFPLPEELINVAFGEMGRTLLLGSSNVSSSRLDELGLRPELQSIDNAVAALVDQRL
jgi:NAD dependent epimerase/dehydratase family enzyme